MSKVDRKTVEILKRHKLLRGSFATRMKEVNPCQYDFLVLYERSLRPSEMPEFLSRFTLEEIGRDLDWVRSYTYYLHKRFPLPEVEERLKQDPNQWQWYLEGLKADIKVSQMDKNWAILEDAMRGLAKMTEEDYKRLKR